MTPYDAHTRPLFERCALITIDVQNDTLDGAPFEIPGTSAMLPQIDHLCRCFRHSGRPIIHVIRIYTADAADVDRCRRRQVLAGAPLLLKGSAGRRPADAILPAPSIRIDDDRLLAGGIQSIGPAEIIMFKPRWGAFYRTPLESHLQTSGVDTLVFAGCNFPNCTRASIYQASERDFRIAAAVDAISAITPPDIDWLRGIGVFCADTATLCRAVEAAAGGPPQESTL